MAFASNKAIINLACSIKMKLAEDIELKRAAGNKTK
jgi:hypothetical protein